MDDAENWLLEQYVQPEAPADEPQKPKLTRLADEMKELKRTLDDLEETRKPIQARYDEVRKRLLPDAMTEAGVSNFRMTGGGSIYISNKISASVKEEDRQSFFNWLRDHGHASLIQPQVHPSTLTAWTKEQLEAKNPIGPYVRLWEEPLAILRSK